VRADVLLDGDEQLVESARVDDGALGDRAFARGIVSIWQSVATPIVIEQPETHRVAERAANDLGAAQSSLVERLQLASAKRSSQEKLFFCPVRETEESQSRAPKRARRRRLRRRRRASARTTSPLESPPGTVW